MGSHQRKDLLASIRGQTVVMPNMRPIFEKYTGEPNPNYRALIPVVDRKLESLEPNEKRLAKLKTADFALFASHSPNRSPPTASHPIIEGFRVIGDELRTAYTIEQRQNLFEDLKFYIGTTETEQRFHLDGKLPTLKEYWEVRMGTSAVAACLAMIEFTNKIKGPYRSTNHPLLKALSDEANIIVIMQKEIVQGCLDSLIPLSVSVCGGVQQAIDRAQTDLLAAVDRFDAEAEKILSGPNTTGFSDRELRIFVDGCRDCWVGNFNWSLCTGRYGLDAIDQKGGSFNLSL
ncbi:hypothetical protein PZA11_001923 [Diplocarpon coronariae]